MASQGPNSPNAATSSGGTAFWSFSPTHVKTSNNSYATISLADVDECGELRATDFGFTIPAGATIDGIIVDVERNGGTDVIDYCKLMKGGVTQITEKGGSALSGTDTIQSFGGASDLWSNTWSYSDINASNFGVAYIVVTTNMVSADANVDHITVTVHYTASTGGRCIQRRKMNQVVFDQPAEKHW